MKHSRQEVENDLLTITRQLLDESGETHHREVKLNASLQRHLGIDSLTRAELFHRIEKKFAVTLPDKLLAEAETLNDIANELAFTESKNPNHPDEKKIISHGARPHLDLSHAKTLIDVLWLYGEKSPEKAHIFFKKEDGTEEIITYGQLLETSLRIAKGLINRGLNSGDTVAIMQPTHPDFFYTFFGILLAGGVPVPIYPPFRMHMLETYVKTEAHILRNAEARILVTFGEAETLSRLLKSFIPELKHIVTVKDLLNSDKLSASFHAHSHLPALIQYTSGSTANPKGVLLTHANLLANIHAYGKAIAVTPEDVAVSWLPLYHDMGLIGMWLGSLYYGVPLVLMAPFSFLNHPERWLWAIHYHRGTISAAPNFAYELCIRKIESGLLEGLDLSSWRIAANGAEKIYPHTLIEFEKKFAAYGLKKTALLPVYGLAESAVALAISPLDREFKLDHVDRKLFEEKREAQISTDKNALIFVACGKPMQGHEIRIVDDNQNELPERHVGNVQFRGPSAMQGYYHNPVATQAILHDGWLDSGDLAYIAQEEIYITGRRKDLIIKAGRNLYPAEIESMVETVKDVRHGCVVAFEVTDAKLGTEQLIIVAETRMETSAIKERIINDIREVIASSLDIVPDRIVLVKPHVIPKTSSGKLQRALCKKMYEEKRLQKGEIPASLQMLKLVTASLMQRVKKIGAIFLRAIYTAYIVIFAALTFLPIYFYGRNATREKTAKAMQLWSKCVLAFAFCPITIKNNDKLVAFTNVIYAANHTSYIDALLMMAILPAGTRIVVKKEVFSMPMIGTIARKLEYFGVDRMDFSRGQQDTKRIFDALASGASIMIFPEGTFGYAAGLRPFRLGAFKLAAESGAAICPLAIKGMRIVWRADEKLMRPNRITITVCDLIKPAGKEWQDVTNLRNAVRAAILEYCGEPSLDFIAAQVVATSD